MNYNTSEPRFCKVEAAVSWDWQDFLAGGDEYDTSVDDTVGEAIESDVFGVGSDGNALVGDGGETNENKPGLPGLGTFLASIGECQIKK